MKIFLILPFINLISGSLSQKCDLISRNQPADSKKCYVADENVDKTLNGLALIPQLNNIFQIRREGDKILMDPELCIDHCADYLFKYAALKNGSECYCGGDSVAEYYNQQSNDTLNCNTTCASSLDLNCGGEKAYKIYSTVNKKHYLLNKSVNMDKKLDMVFNNSSPWYIGCVKDGPSCRTLNGIIGSATVKEDENSMTVDKCLDICSQGSFKYAGLEDGTQCFCGDVYTINGQASHTNKEECSSSCSGNELQICGGSFALSVYEVSAKLPIPSSTSSSFPPTPTPSGVSDGSNWFTPARIGGIATGGTAVVGASYCICCKFLNCNSYVWCPSICL